MKLGCMLYSLGRSIANDDITVPEALAHIKKSGGEGVDMMESICANYTAAEVKAMADDAGLVISSHIGGRSFTQADSPTLPEDLDALKKLIDDSVEMGTSVLLVTTGGCAEGQDKADGRKNVASALAQVLPYAAQAGVTLTIEDFGSPVAPYQTGAEVMETCELAGPELKITYDSGNMVMGDEDPVDFLKIVAPRVVHAHAKDWALVSEDEGRLKSRAGKTYIGTVCGEGVLDYPAVIAELNQMNYQGYLSFEYEGVNNPVEMLYQGMAYLGDLIAGA